MYDYKGRHELKVFYTIPEVCELLELNMDKLRYQCILHCILPCRLGDGTLGLDLHMFHSLNNALYQRQCREGIYDGDPWAEANFPNSTWHKGTMFDYMKVQHCDTFFTIQEACKILGFTRNELRSKCEQYGVEIQKNNLNGQWGFWGENFRRFNNTLYYEQCRDGSDDSRIWTEASTSLTNQQNTIRGNFTMRNYIKNIKGLKSIYTYDETCQLLGVTKETLDRVCDQNDFMVFADSDGTPIFTCYEFLTLNNRLYREECEASGKEMSCA